MKKLLLFIIIFLLSLQNVLAEDNVKLQGNVSFDWVSKTQLERDKNINDVKNIIYKDDIVKKYNKKPFRAQYSEFLKDSKYKEHYIAVVNRVKENNTERMSGFFTKNGKILYAYGIQYKNNMKEVYYYNTFGTLIYIDKYSSNYPEFPYYTHQYNSKGELVGSIYFTQYDTQYVFKNGKFKGIWYKNTMFNSKAKKIMTRSNY